MLNVIVRYFQKEWPNSICIEYIAEGHDISQILAQLAIEDREELWRGSESDAESEDGRSDSAHASAEEAASNFQLPASITDIEETLPSPFVTQFDGLHEARQVSNSADHHGIAEVNSPTSPLAQALKSCSQKRKHGTTPINRPAKRTKT